MLDWIELQENIVFIDGDDYILQETIETLYHLIVSYRAVVFSASFCVTLV